MNANNGEILAMASNEEYNLNSPRNLSGIISEDELGHDIGRKDRSDEPHMEE